MTEIVNKKTGERIISDVSTSKKKWLELMRKENPDFFERSDINDLWFMPMDGDF